MFSVHKKEKERASVGGWERSKQKGKVNHRVSAVERKAKEEGATKEARVIPRESNLALLSTALLAPIASTSRNMDNANITTPRMSTKSS